VDGGITCSFKTCLKWEEEIGAEHGWDLTGLHQTTVRLLRLSVHLLHVCIVDTDCGDV